MTKKSEPHAARSADALTATKVARIKAKLANKAEKAMKRQADKQHEMVAKAKRWGAPTSDNRELLKELEWRYMRKASPEDVPDLELRRKDAVIASLRARIQTLTDENKSLRDRLFSPPPKRARGRPRSPERAIAKPGRKPDIGARMNDQEYANRVLARSDKEDRSRLQVIKAMLKEDAAQSGKVMTPRELDLAAKRANSKVSRQLLKTED